MTNHFNSNPFDGNEMEPFEGNEGGRPLIWALLGGVAIVICLLFISAFIGFQPDRLSLSDRYFPSPTATATRTPSPTLTPTPNLTATVRSFESTATSSVNQWNILYVETFDTNEKHWETGIRNDEFADIDREIEDGKYRWTATANKGFTSWILIESRHLNDFSISVDAREAKNPNVAEYGLIFTESRDGNFYYFGINHKHEYFVSIRYKDEWEDLITPTFSQAIRPIGFNRLTIVRQGPHFLFFINDHYVGELTDDRIKTGIASLAISMNRAKDTSIFEFDNIELRSP